MKFFKGFGALLLGTFIALSGCGTHEVEDVDSDRLQVVATLFPQYDFVRQIAGDKVEVTKLLPIGIDAHSFEPTPADIKMINDADLFIFTGEEMEPWAQRIIDSLDNEIDILDVSINVPLIPWGEVDEDYNHDADHNHDHDEDHNHDHDADHNHDHDADHNHSHSHEGCDHAHDPHIWTSPVNAKIMVNNVLEALIALDPENKEFYRENAEAYLTELETLDASLREIVANAKRDTIYHAGRFAVHYLMHDYGINFVAAPLETEPSVALVAQMITDINEYGIPAIFHEELVNPRIAQMISDETGATMLLLHSLHNVSNEELEAGVTYLSLMEQNIENLRLGLN